MDKDLRSYSMLKTDNAYNNSKSNSYNDPSAYLDQLSARNHSLYDIHQSKEIVTEFTKGDLA